MILSGEKSKICRLLGLILKKSDQSFSCDCDKIRITDKVKGAKK